MRVVGGSAGGIPLISPKTELRPTMEVVKNAIFNSLMESIPDARVLDLFAGSGSLGIEALSRGAQSATFVESDKRAAEVIQKNLDKTRLTGGILVATDVFKWLKQFAPTDGFDIVIADPPYIKHSSDRDFVTELLQHDDLLRTLQPGGLFILEHMPGMQLPTGDRWHCIRQKRYGATEVALLKAV